MNSADDDFMLNRVADNDNEQESGDILDEAFSASLPRYCTRSQSKTKIFNVPEAAMPLDDSRLIHQHPKQHQSQQGAL
jgi:hypothetical protein